ncbi:MAG: TetR/AcrR family transcriptional regulator [Spirochaetae bacterium HGW-Spirochaetae-7]|jgi:AcrR family transcriptional regulator|nr:MAG: TetR/AcrR family transcriptional regulator [Spirochaetae bacterium HGW-Spirochaetae-7]
MDTQIRSERRTRKATALYEVALDAFAELGFREAGVEEIARRAGIANGTIYVYAASKRDLYRLVVEYGLGQWQDAAAAAALAVGSGPRLARTRFEALCRAAFCYLESEPRLRRILARDPSLFPAATGTAHGEDPFGAVNRRSVEMLRRAILDGMESGEFHVDDPTAAAELLFSLYRVLIESAYVQDNGDERRRFEAGLSIILDGISKR